MLFLEKEQSWSSSHLANVGVHTVNTELVTWPKFYLLTSAIERECVVSSQQQQIWRILATSGLGVGGRYGGTGCEIRWAKQKASVKMQSCHDEHLRNARMQKWNILGKKERKGNLQWRSVRQKKNYLHIKAWQKSYLLKKHDRKSDERLKKAFDGLADSGEDH